MSTVFLDISSVPLCTSILNAHFDSLLVAWHLKENKKNKNEKTFFVGTQRCVSKKQSLSPHQSVLT